MPEERSRDDPKKKLERITLGNKRSPSEEKPGESPIALCPPPKPKQKRFSLEKKNSEVF